MNKKNEKKVKNKMNARNKLKFPMRRKFSTLILKIKNNEYNIEQQLQPKKNVKFKN